MKDKTQYEALVGEFQKTAENFRVAVVELGEKFSKLLPDIEISDEEEDTWEMKCPYKVGDKHYCIQSSGDVFLDWWKGIEADNSFFSQGNIFPTKQAAELEAKRRNLLTRFRAFRDECNDGWKPDMVDASCKKYCLFYSEMKNSLYVSYIVLGTHFHIFSYFKNEEDAERAIELFGQEIIELYVEDE